MNLYRLVRVKPYLNHHNFSSVVQSSITNNPITPIEPPKPPRTTAKKTPKSHLQIESYGPDDPFQFSEDRHADEILEAYMEMKEIGIKLSPRLYMILIKNLTKEGRRIDFVMAAQVCRTCIKQSWFKDFFKDNPLIMNTLLKGVGMTSLAEFKKLVKALKTHDLQPDVFFYNQVIQNLCQQMKPADAVKYFDMLSSSGIKFESHTYEVLFKELDEEMNLPMIQRLYKDACEKNVQLHSECFERLINVLLKNLDFAGALNAWKHYDTNKSPKRKFRYFCGDVLYRLCEDVKVHEAKALFDWMLLRDITPDEFSMRQLIWLYCEYKYVEEKDALEFEMTENLRKIISSFSGEGEGFPDVL